MVARCWIWEGVSCWRSGPIGLARYREYLVNLAVPDERKDEVIRTLVSFFHTLIDQAFGVDPVRLAVKVRLIDRATGNLRAVQILLRPSKIETTMRYLGIGVEDALALAENTEI